MSLLRKATSSTPSAASTSRFDARREADVALALDEVDARLTARQPLAPQPVGGAVARAVVEHPDLPRHAGVVLLGEGGEAGLEVGAPVPTGDEDGDAGHQLSDANTRLRRRRRRKPTASGGATVGGRKAKRSRVSSRHGRSQNATSGGDRVLPGEAAGELAARRAPLLALALVAERRRERRRQCGRIRRRHHPAGSALAHQPRHRAALGEHHRAAGGERVEKARAQRQPRLQRRPVRRAEHVDVAQQVEAALGGDPIERAHALAPPAASAAALLDLREQRLRRSLDVGVRHQVELPVEVGKALERVEQREGVVPVVEPAEEDPPLAATPLGKERLVRRQLIWLTRHSERHLDDQPLEIRVARQALRVDAAERGQEPRVVEPLLRRGAEEEVAARQLQHPRRVVVAPGVEAERRQVVRVLHQPGIVEVDRRRQLGAGEHEVVGELPLRHGGVAVRDQLAHAFGREGTDLSRHRRHLGDRRRRDQHHLDAGPRQPAGQLEVADADPRHALAHGLAGEQRDPRHRPRLSRCRRSWVRQARVARISSSSPLSRAISA